MKKKLILLAKIVAMVVVLGCVAREVYKSLHNQNLPAGWWQRIRFDWGYGAVALAGMAGVMLSSALVWVFLVRRMGARGPMVRWLGTYTFSQMGKYVPGKVMLLLMRVERAGRFGISARICTLSTLLENALYMVSGGLAGMAALTLHTADLAQSGQQWAKWVLPASAAATAVLVMTCHPRIFYGLVNMLLKKAGRDPVAPAERLGMGTLATSVLLFLTCWFFGGLALWAVTSMVQPLPLWSAGDLMGAFALSVIVGMASFLPGGLGIRESVIILFVYWAIQPAVGKEAAVPLATVVAVLQRLTQLAAEAGLGVAGVLLTSRSGVNVAEATAVSKV